MVFLEEGCFCRPRQTYQTKFRADLNANTTYTFDTMKASSPRVFFTRLLEFWSKYIFLVLVRAKRTSAPEQRDMTNKLIVVCSLPPSSVQASHMATMAWQALRIRPIDGPF